MTLIRVLPKLDDHPPLGAYLCEPCELAETVPMLRRDGGHSASSRQSWKSATAFTFRRIFNRRTSDEPAANAEGARGHLPGLQNNNAPDRSESHHQRAHDSNFPLRRMRHRNQAGIQSRL